MLARPGLPSFDYVRASSLEEASRLLLDLGAAAKLMAGGTDLFPRMRDGLLRPQVVVDIKAIPGLTEIRHDSRSGLTIGAAVNLNRLIGDAHVQRHYPLLAEAAGSVASYQVRNRATLGGNLCNASPAADMAPAVLCLDGEVVLFSSSGVRNVAARDFFLGPGRTAMAAGEMVLEVRLPAESGSRGRYIKLGRNKVGDLAIVGVAVCAYPDKSRAGAWRFRIGLASVAPVPMRAVEAEEVLADRPLTRFWFEVAANVAAESTSPIDDVRASAAYRKEMVRNLVLRGLREVADQSERGARGEVPDRGES